MLYRISNLLLPSCQAMVWHYGKNAPQEQTVESTSGKFVEQKRHAHTHTHTHSLSLSLFLSLWPAHSDTHTDIQTHKHTCTPNSQTDAPAYKNTRKHTDRHTNTSNYTHARMCMRTHTARPQNLHLRAYTRAEIHTCANKQTCTGRHNTYTRMHISHVDMHTRCTHKDTRTHTHDTYMHTHTHVTYTQRHAGTPHLQQI